MHKHKLWGQRKWVVLAAPVTQARLVAPVLNITVLHFVAVPRCVFVLQVPTAAGSMQPGQAAGSERHAEAGGMG